MRTYLFFGLGVVLSAAVMAPVRAQAPCCGQPVASCDSCQTYRVGYSTVYEDRQMTVYRVEYETVYDQRQVTSYRPVWETQIRESRYMVAKPIYETSEREERYAVQRPVVETRVEDRSYDVVRNVYETSEREERYMVQRPVMETQDSRRAFSRSASCLRDQRARRELHGHAAGDDLPRGASGPRSVRRAASLPSRDRSTIDWPGSKRLAWLTRSRDKVPTSAGPGLGADAGAGHDRGPASSGNRTS